MVGGDRYTPRYAFFTCGLSAISFAGPERTIRPGLQDVGAVGDGEGHLRVLLDEEDARALLVDLDDDRKISSTRMGERPIDGSSRRRRVGLLMRPRAVASICCSPPESVPPYWLARSFRRGKLL